MGAMGVVGEGLMGVGYRVPLGVDVARVLGGFSFWCFSLARWARLSLRCGDNRGENTGGFWQERRLEDRSCPGVLDVMCVSEIQFSIAMTCF